MTDVLNPTDPTVPVIDPPDPEVPVVVTTPPPPPTVIEVGVGNTTINTVVQTPAQITTRSNPVQVIEVTGIPIKYGDEATTALLMEHINSRTPHPVYDDLPSLTLLFENGII